MGTHMLVRVPLKVVSKAAPAEYSMFYVDCITGGWLVQASAKDLHPAVHARVKPPSVVSFLSDYLCGITV